MKVPAERLAMGFEDAFEVTPIGAAADHSFETLYRDHTLDVFRYALVLTRNVSDAEDVTAETFERGLRAWQQGRGPGASPLPWLFTIARHVATDRWRHATRAVRHMMFESLKEADISWIEAQIWLDAMTQILPARQREVVVLRYRQDLSDAEIGSLMGLTESGVRSLAARAIATLRKHPEVWK